MSCVLTLLDVVGCRENKGIILSCFGTKEANALGLVSKGMKWAVECYPWEDVKTRIRNIPKWKLCFPYARSASICSYRNLKRTDADLECLKGIHTLRMFGGNEITDEGLKHLAGIHTLEMFGCVRITDEGLKHLAGIHKLNIRLSVRITSEGLKHLAGIHTLEMADCVGITDEGLDFLREQGTVVKECHYTW